MADSDNQLNIDINLRTQKTGADAVQEIKKVKVAAADLSNTTKELEGNVVKHTAQQKKFAEATHGLGMAMRFLPGPIREVVMALRLLFTNPIVAFFVLGASAIKLFADQLKKLHENAATVELLKGVGASIREAREAVSAALDPLGEYTEALKAAGLAASAVDAQTKDAIANIEQTAKLKEREADAEDKLAAARLAARHAGGEITDEQFAKESADMASRVEGRQASRSAATAAAVIAAKEKGLAEAQGRTGGLANDVTSTAERRAMLEAAIKTAEDDLVALREKDRTGNLTKEEAGLLSQRSAQKASAQYDLPSARAAETNARRAFDSNTSTIGQLSRELPGDRQRAAAQAASDQAVNALNRESRGPLGLASGAARAATNWSRGQAASGSDTGDYQQLRAQLKIKTDQEAELKKLLVEVLKDGILTKEELAAMRQRYANQPP